MSTKLGRLGWETGGRETRESVSWTFLGHSKFYGIVPLLDKRLWEPEMIVDLLSGIS